MQLLWWWKVLLVLRKEGVSVNSEKGKLPRAPREKANHGLVLTFTSRYLSGPLAKNARGY